MKSFILSASILSANFRHLEEDICTAVDAGIDWIHVDVMDGQFAPNISMGPFIVDFCRQITSIPIDVHLMIQKPENHIKAFANAGANLLTIHPEGNLNVLRTLQEIKALGCKTGLALNPGTSETVIRPLIEFLDLILILTVNPGFSGQSFIPEVKYKIREVKKLIDTYKPNTFLQVDGGVNLTNIDEILELGASVIVSANAVFNYSEGIKKGVSLLKTRA